MPSITLKNVQFTNVKDKRQGLKMSNILTQSNVGSQSVANYINSENFYKLVSALDIAWGDISVGNGVIISDTADLINWISSLPASGGGGKSAYELYVEEEEGKGNTPLSLSEWLESLQGQQGIAGVSPHIDPSTGNWFIGETNTGVHAQGIDGSQGPQGIQGIQGKSNYELYLETVPQGETPLTQLEWLDSLKGQNGTNGINGTDGTDGKSAYEIYVDHVPNGSTALTEEAWLASLKGKDGKDGNRGLTGESAYEIYFRNADDPLSEEEWLESLKGADGTMSFEELTDEQRASLVGETGPAGPSAYQSYRNTTADDPILTEEEWIASLHGQTGAAGTTPHIDASTKHWFIGNTDTNILAEGVNGQDGQPGADGSNGITPHIDPITGNWFIGETDTEVHAQGVPGIDGSNGITPHIDPTTGNWFIGETDTEVHAQGETGQSGADGITPHIDASTGNWFIGETNTGIPAQGPTGQNGADGSTGKSAYELYIDGIQEGEPLSQEDWLASLKGDEGDSAYEVAVTNGFVGTEQQWLDSLLPTINVDPSSNNASDIYWFIKGEKTQYRAIPQIISITSAAYEALQEKDETAIYVITDSQYNQDNEVAYRIGNITPTTDMNNLDVSVRRSNNVVYFDFTLPIANLDVNNLTEAQATLLRGKSNYQIYVDNHDVDLDGPLLTEEQWLATLKGEVGNDGKSTYELYTENYISTHGDDTGMLTESEWLNSLIPQIVKDSSDNLYWHINNQKTQYRAFPKIQFLTLDEYDALETKEDDVVYIIDNDKEATALTFNIGNVTTSALETDASVNIRRIDNSIYFDFVLPFSIDSSEYKGESAYEIYRRNASTGEVLSETAWIDSLKGKSAYELFAAANPTSVYTNESQWLASLKGEPGKDGSQGPQGPMPTITINQEGNWVVNNQVMQSALGRLPEIRNGLYIDPETGDELSMKTWWIDGADTNVPTSLGVDVTTLLNKIGAIGNAQEFEPSTYYTAEDEEVIGGTKEVGDLKTPAVAAVPHTVKSYVDNAVANVHVDIDASNIYTKSEVDQKFEDLIGQAPETLDTLKEIADKLSDEDTSLGQLNAVLLNKADVSTTYTKSEVDTLYNNINSSLNDYVLQTDLDDTEKVIAAALVQLNESVTNIDASIVNIRQNSGSVNPNDLSIYELKSDLINDLSIYTTKTYVDQKFEDLIGQAPETLDTLKEIADKLSDEDTSLGQLNAILAVKADTSTTYTKSEVSTLLENYVTVADISANEYVIASALVELNSNKADKDTTYTKSEIDSIIENLDNGVDPNDLSIYELKSDLANDLSIYELKSDLTNDLSIYELKSDLANDLSIYVLNSSLIEIEEVISGAISSLNTNKVDVSTLNDYVQKTALENSEKVIAAALVQLNESVTNIDASIISIKQNGTGGTINPNDLSIYELKADLANDLSIYTSKTYVDQKFDDLINNAPATLDTLKEIADKLSDDDTSLGQLNAILAVKADTSTTYTKSEVDTLYNNINSSLNYYVLNSSLIDVEEVVAESITQLNDALDELSGNVYTKDEIDNLVISSDDLSIYELKSELTNDLSIYQLKSELSNDLSIYVLKTDLEDTEKVIATALIQINDSITTIDASIVDIKQNGSGNSGINSSVLDDYVLKTYIGTLPNKTDNIYYTQEEITNASVGDDAYGKTTADIKIPATQYIDLMEAIQEDEEVTAAAIVDMNSKVTDISTRLDRLNDVTAGPAIWVGTQSQYNSLESIDQTTIYIIKADEV